MSVYATAWSTTPRSTAIRRRSRRGAASATAAEVLMLPWLLLLVCAIEIGELRAGRARGNNNLSKLLLLVWFGVTCGEGLLICISSCWLIGQVKDFFFSWLAATASRVALRAMQVQIGICFAALASEKKEGWKLEWKKNRMRVVEASVTFVACSRSSYARC